MNLLILVVDDEPDVEMLFRAHFRRDLREKRFTMEFAQSGNMALQRISDAAAVSLILILSDINMPGMTGLELLPKAKAARPDVPVIMITAYGDADTKRNALESRAEARSPSRSILERSAARSTRGSSGPPDAHNSANECPLLRSLLGAKRTCLVALQMSACDPKRHALVL
jgi:CheY-like chemotaxis protein